MTKEYTWNIIKYSNSDNTMRRNRPYDGQSHTSSGERGKTEIKGITLRDLRDAYVRAYCLSSGIDNPKQYGEASKGEFASLTENEIFNLKGEIDPIAVVQNLSCEIERLMGIYPNIK